MPIRTDKKSATIGLIRRNEINDFLDNSVLVGSRISKVLLTGPVVRTTDSEQEITVGGCLVLVLDSGEAFSVNMQGAMYNSITLDMETAPEYWASEASKDGNDKYESLIPVVGKKISSVGYWKEKSDSQTLRVTFDDGSALFVFHPTEDSFHVKF